MKKILIVLALGLIVSVASCSDNDKYGKTAALTAKQYYDNLFKGDYNAYVSGIYFPDSIPSTYRDQLIANAKMFVVQQQTSHRGVNSISVSGVKVDTAKHAANAFLLLAYGDSTKEEIVVPMVEAKGIWYMK